jgi:hypothetical protein
MMAPEWWEKFEKKSEIKVSDKEKIVIYADEMGNYKSAEVENTITGERKQLSPVIVREQLTLNGRPITYIKPGSVIITRTNPICIHRTLPDGTIQLIEYPPGSGACH